METKQGYNNLEKRDNSFFQKIDTIDKAYILGFIIGDAAISDRAVEISVAIKDKGIVEYICENIGSNMRLDMTTDIAKRRFPRARTSVATKEFVDHVKTAVGGTKKKCRRLPRISSDLVPYMVLGFFDADGCITWGKRKDRDRLWQKVSFTADMSILSGLQSIFSDNDITTQLRPKSKEDVYVLEITNELNVYKILKFLPLEFSKLPRKSEYFYEWLLATIDKYSFRVGDYVSSVDRRTLSKYSIGHIFRSAFSNKKIIDIVDDDNVIVESIGTISRRALTKKGMSNYALRLKLDENGENQ